MKLRLVHLLRNAEGGGEFEIRTIRFLGNPLKYVIKELSQCEFQRLLFHIVFIFS